MSHKELTVAVIGAGAIAFDHFEAIRTTDGLKECAVADLDPEKRRKIADKFGVRAYRDYRELIETERPDVVTIALPHFLHKEAAIFAAGFGCHIMLEKPMALTVSECDEMIQAAESANVHVLIGHTQHYMAENIAAKQMIQNGEIGQLVMIHDVRNVNYFQPSRPSWFLEKSKSGGGIIANLGTHSIDKIQWLTDSAVRRVNASVSFHGDRGDVEGSGLIYMELENGMPATVVQSGYPGAPRNETEIIGTNGMIKLLTGDSLWLSRGGEYKQVEVPGMPAPFELQYADLLRSIRSGQDTGCMPAYGRNVIKVLETVYRSAQYGAEQYVEEARP